MAFPRCCRRSFVAEARGGSLACLRDEASVAKEARKAAEEKRLRGMTKEQKKKNGKGDKGDDEADGP